MGSRTFPRQAYGLGTDCSRPRFYRQSEHRCSGLESDHWLRLTTPVSAKAPASASARPTRAAPSGRLTARTVQPSEPPNRSQLREWTIRPTWPTLAACPCTHRPPNHGGLQHAISARSKPRPTPKTPSPYGVHSDGTQDVTLYVPAAGASGPPRTVQVPTPQPSSQRR